MMEQLTFSILAIVAIALWTVANCVGTWASHLDNRIKLLKSQRMAMQTKKGTASGPASSSDDSYDEDIVDDVGEVDILPEEPAPMQQAA